MARPPSSCRSLDVILLVLGVVYLGVRQARHPVAPGRRHGPESWAEQRGSFWGGR